MQIANKKSSDILYRKAKSEKKERQIMTNDKTPLVDLHTHSTASDGSDSPSQLLKTAEEAGLAAVALCDHDTVSGLEEFETAAATSSVEAIPGIEISTQLFKKEVHIVGLFVNRNSTALLEPLQYLRQARLDRNRQVIERLRTAGFMITEEDVAEFAAGESIGRPHIARALVKKGYFEDIYGAFAKCLKRGTPFYVPRKYLSPEESIRLIHEAGGLAIWAHPMHERRGDRAFLRKFLKEMIPWGLDGLEGYYALFTERQQAIAQAVAGELDLAISGGSDYHGVNQPSISIGNGQGNLMIPCSVLDALKQRLEKKRMTGC